MDRTPTSTLAAYPCLDFQLGETVDMLRNAVQSFAATEIAPRAAGIDASNEFPMDLWRKLGSLGVLGLTVEEDYGGAGLGYLAHIVAMEEISRASASVSRNQASSSIIAMTWMSSAWSAWSALL